MFRSTGLINLRSILADRIARGLVAIFAVTLLQGIFTGPEVVFADESPAIEISAPTITTTFGEEASGVISAVGGTPGYTFGYTGSVPGVSFAYIDSTSVGVQVAANAPPGTYRETITATDIANKRSAAPFEIRILKAPRTIQVIAPLSSLNQEETMSLTTIVDSTIRDELKPIMSNDGVLSYQSSTPSICSVNQNTGEVKAIAPSGQCQITATVVGGTYFENATSNFSLSVATPPPEQTPPAQQEPITPTSEPSPSPTSEPTPEPSSEPTPEPTPSSDEAAEVPMTMSSFSASNSATLIFQSNNGSGTSTTQIEGGPANLTANPFTRIGYTFLGWSTDSSASTPLYLDQSSFSFSSDETLYAIWQIDTFTISVNFNDQGTVTPSTRVVNYGENVTFTFQPNNGATVRSVLVNGLPVTNLSIFYDSNGATSGTAPPATLVVSGSSYTPENNPGNLQKTGFVFSGWTTVLNDAATLVTDSISISTNTTLYARWTVATYTITLTTTAGGTVSPSTSSTVQYGETVTYYFAAGAEKQIQKIVVNGVSQGAISSYTFGSVAMNHTLDVFFETVTYPVYFNANGGTGGTTVQVYKGANAIDSAPAVTRAGYTFLGWSQDGTYLVTNLQITTQAETVTALWQLNSYPVTFDVNGGTGESITVSIEYGANALSYESKPATTREGYTFAGWGVDTVTAVASHTVTETKTLYAIWSPQSYPVTFDANGGTNETGTSSSITQVTYGSNAIPLAPVVTRAGHTLRGWSIDGTNIVTTYPIIETTTLRALWQADTFAINLVQTTGGTLAATIGGAISYGGSETVSITAASGYYIWDVLVNGVSIGAVSQKVFNNVTAAETITAVFKKTTIVVTASKVGNGTISPSGANSVAVTFASAGSISFTFEAVSGYHLDTVTVGGVIVPVTGNSLTLSGLRDDTAVIAYFVIDTFLIVATADPGGSISPSGNVSVNSGSNQRFTITTNPGYTFFKIEVDEFEEPTTLRNGLPTFTFENVQLNHTIRAFFNINSYNVTTSAGANGSISPLGTRSLEYGTRDTITITPNVGYKVANVTVNGVSVGSVTQYIIESVTGTTTIVATFTIETFTIVASAGAGGSITDSGTTIVSYGASKTYTFTPSTNYHVKDVLINGVSVGAKASHTFSSVTANQTISVTFELDTYTIIFRANGGSSDSTAVFSHGSNIIASAPTVTRTGYRFLGFSTTLNDSLTIVASRSATANETLFAFWQIETYTITFNPNGGSLASGQLSQIVNYGTEVIALAPTLTRSGFTFAGWTIDSPTLITSHIAVADTTIIALWVVNVALSGDTLITTTQGRSESLTPVTSGGLGVKTYTISGVNSALNFSIDAATGKLTIPSTVPQGTYYETITATDSAGVTASRVITILVNPPVTLSGGGAIITTAGRAESSVAFTAIGGTGALTFTISGSVAGVTVTSLGVVKVDSLTPSGVYNLTVTATDSLGMSDSESISITVNARIEITGSAMLFTTVGRALDSPQYLVTGGTGAITFSLSGTHESITINSSTGIIRVDSTLPAGTYYETITATDTLLQTDTHLVTITVNAGMAIIGSASIQSTQGRQYQPTIYGVSGGTTPYIFTITSGTAGITINTSGQLTIAETVNAGTYYETITVTDTSGATAIKALTILVNPAITITGGSNETTTAGRADSTSAFVITGGTGELSFALTPTITGITGNVTETRIVIASNTAPGTYLVTLTATDERGDTEAVTVVIVVNPAVTFSSAPTLQSTLGRAWTFPRVSGLGGTGTLGYSILTPTDSITINPVTGQISVTNQIPVGTYSITVIATDEFLETGSIQINVVINPLMTFDAVDSLVTTQGLAKSTSAITVTGGTAPKVFSITGGPGISIDSVTGVVTVSSAKVAGTYIETITVTDSVGATTQDTITIIVNGPLTITQGSNITTTYGRSDSSTPFTSGGGTGLRTFTISGTNPGITVDQDGRVQVSANAIPGTYMETVSVTDQLNVVETRSITIIINETVTFRATGALKTTLNRLRNFDSVTVTGGTGPITYSYPATNAGITLNTSTGRITIGSTVGQGTYYETITATDIYGFTDSVVVTLIVNAKMALTVTSGIINTLGRTTPYTITSLTGGTDTKTYVITSVTTGGLVTISETNGVVTVSGSLAAGSYIETITVTDVAGDTATETVSITVNSSVDLTAGSNIITTVGRAESSTAFVGVGGTGVKRFSISTNSHGITIDSVTGIVYATGATAGIFTETVTVSDALGATSETRIVVTVNARPDINAISSLGSTFGSSRTFTAVTLTGGSSPFTYSISNNIDSFTINASNGQVTVSGSLAVGTYSFRVTITDQFGYTDSATVSFTVNGALTLTAPADETSTAGFTRTLSASSASGGTGTRTFSLVSTPSGFSIDSSTGAITIGSSVVAGTYALTVRVTDSIGVTADDGINIVVSTALSLTIADTVITTTTSRGETITSISAGGGTGSLQYSIAPTVSGITIDSTTGTIRLSTSLAAGEYLETVTITDRLSYTKTLLILIRVNAKAQVGGSGSLSTTAGITTTFTALSTTGGTGAITFSLTGNAAGTVSESRTGFSINSSGVLTVASTLASDTYTIYVKVTDSLDISTVRTITLRVNAAMTFQAFDTFTSTYGRSHLTNGFTINGGTGTKTFTITSLGSGVTINASTGALTIPSSLAISTYFETVTVTDASGATSETAVVIVINETPTVSGPDTLVTTRGKAATTTTNFTGTLGTTPYTFTITGGASGITINPSSGQVRVAETTTAGTYTETITLTDARGAMALDTITITVNARPQITGGSNITTTFSRADSTSAFSTSGGTGALVLTMTNTRAQITFDAGLGVVKVDSTLVAGTYYETLTVTDSLGETATQMVTILVNQSVAIANVGPVRTTVGYSRTSAPFTATLGTGSKTFSMTQFQSGLTIGATTGRVTVDSAVPVGTYLESITATDALGVSTSITVTIIVADTVVLTAGSNISTTKGVTRSSLAFQAVGGTETITYTLNNPPAGITIDSRTGVVSVASNVASAGTIYETVTATDVMGSSDSKSITIVIYAAVAITGDTQVTTTRGRAESTSVYAITGGAGGYVFTISPVVSGISINSTTGRVTIASTTAAGVYRETITLTDSEGATTSISLLVTVNRELSIDTNTVYATTRLTSRTFTAFTVD
ncbi:MAG: hypothetical protein EBX97_00805, partial [Actinobacteria bacterium]|nr:hypothetical protein [Actinomycetota bacterium]